MATIIDKRDNWNRLAKELKKAKKSVVKVGVQADRKRQQDDGQSMVTIAIHNEFGTERIPARPFVSKAFEANKHQLTQQTKHGYNKILEGGNVKQELQKLGEWFVGKVKHTIQTTTEPPNSARTIKQKGSSHPLIDTGQLVQSITAVVEE